MKTLFVLFDGDGFRQKRVRADLRWNLVTGSWVSLKSYSRAMRYLEDRRTTVYLQKVGSVLGKRQEVHRPAQGSRARILPGEEQRDRLLRAHTATSTEREGEREEAGTR